MFKPMINDITTTYPEVPVLASKAAYPAEFITKQKEAYPDIEPLPCHKTLEECFADCVAVAQQQERWDVEVQTEEHRLYAVATTALLKFKDDIVVEVRSAGDEISVHMRSRSRKGKSDLGANAKRIRKYFGDLKKYWRKN